MGICLSTKSPPRKNNSKRLTNQSGNRNSSNRWSRVRSSSIKRERFDDPVIHEHAIAAALLFQQQNGGVLPFDRSTSVRHHQPNSKRHQPLPRSSSTRARSLTDPLLPPQQLLNQDVNVDELEVKHIVLVHGGGFGAWCWYKTIALLEECKFTVTAIDLTGSGIDLFDTNSVKSLSQYVAPLTNFLEKLVDEEKVILVGHDFGGACISYAMELFPSKIAKAIFVAASMLKSGQSTLDMFSQKENTSDLMRQAQKFLYTNGNNLPPTAMDLDKMLLKDLLFNHSPAKKMGRGVSCGGGQSSLGYLFGSEEGGNTQPPTENPSEDAATAAAADAATTEPSPDNSEPLDDNTTAETDEKPAESYSIINQDPKPATNSSTNNYHRADGQNCGNFITDRPSTKVHAAPGGNSSLGYLFGDDNK